MSKECPSLGILKKKSLSTILACFGVLEIAPRVLCVPDKYCATKAPFYPS